MGFFCVLFTHAAGLRIILYKFLPGLYCAQIYVRVKY